MSSNKNGILSWFSKEPIIKDAADRIELYSNLAGSIASNLSEIDGISFLFVKKVMITERIK